MGVLDQIAKMRSQGTPDEEIIQKLQEQGISPKSINDALNQAEIKNAVNDEGKDENVPTPQGQRMYSPKTQEVSGENYQYPQQMQQEEYYPQPQQQEYAPQSGFSQGEYQQGYENSGYQQGYDTSTVIEISEQVFSEKIKKIQKQVDEFSEFKSLADSKIKNVSERLNRIELMIDKLQAAILEKIGSYGNSLEGIKKEMGMMQDSFGKMLPALAEKSESHAHHAMHKSSRGKKR